MDNLKIKSMELYLKYKDGIITLKEYQRELKPLDNSIDKQELQTVSACLQDIPVFEKSSLKQLGL